MFPEVGACFLWLQDNETRSHKQTARPRDRSRGALLEILLWQQPIFNDYYFPHSLL
jgi:hypothetical protein